MNLKKVSLIAILAIIIISIIAVIVLTGQNKSVNTNAIKVTASNFASYDFIRAIIGENENIELRLLLGAGKDAHSYDPTAQDIITIQNSDLFVYVGGELEQWTQKVLPTIDLNKTKLICITDDVQKIAEQEVDGSFEEEHEHEHEHEEGTFDEHVWTSPENAKKVVSMLEKEIENLDNANAEIYRKNAEEYIQKIDDVDKKIQEVIDNKKRDVLVFGDKMPMQYFINYYNLKVSAAFSGCSTETEPSSKTIAYLVNKAKEEKVPVILYIELNDGQVAKTIAQEVGNGCEAMQIQTLHNVTKQDFDNGETWVSLMTRNINVLTRALQ